jgi:hypothetical protein
MIKRANCKQLQRPKKDDVTRRRSTLRDKGGGINAIRRTSSWMQPTCSPTIRRASTVPHGKVHDELSVMRDHYIYGLQMYQRICKKFTFTAQLWCINIRREVMTSFL